MRVAKLAAVLVLISYTDIFITLCIIILSDLISMQVFAHCMEFKIIYVSIKTCRECRFHVNLHSRIIMIMKRALLLIHFSPDFGYSFNSTQRCFEHENKFMDAAPQNFTLNKSCSVSSMYFYFPYFQSYIHK